LITLSFLVIQIIKAGNIHFSCIISEKVKRKAAAVVAAAVAIAIVAA